MLKFDRLIYCLIFATSTLGYNYPFARQRLQISVDVCSRARTYRSAFYGIQSEGTKLFFEKNSGAPSVDFVGEDAASFDLSSQKPIAWIQFLIAVSGVLGGLFYVWLYDQGPQLGQLFKDTIERIAGGDSTLTITYMLAFFAVCHSGLASLRPFAEEIVGPRVWRYIFAIVSLPLAFSSIVYFINHRFVC